MRRRRLEPMGMVLAAMVLGAPPSEAQQPDDTQARLAALRAAMEPGEDRLDPVARLRERMTAGEVTLERDPDFAFLPSVLEALGVPVESQLLVFSRTSLQVDNIAPWAPRALYFNDDVYVGYTVDGLVLEVASVDPDGGTAFYTVEQGSSSPEFRTDDLTCHGCHAAGPTRGEPGVFMRSFLTDERGNTIGEDLGPPTDDRTPMELRYGGWYVTGRHSLPHAGNVHAPVRVHELDDPYAYAEGFDMTTGGNRLVLDDFEPSFYPGEGSDIVALMVLGHQARVHTLISHAAARAEEARRELALEALAAQRTGEEPSLSASTEESLNRAVDELVRGMLFYRAAPIGDVEGAPDFVESFEARGPWDSQGRSLREFALDGQLFRYPLSFLIYSEGWDALPPVVLDRAYVRLHELLTGPDHDDFPLLDSATRTTLHEILIDTKPEYVAAISDTGV